MKNQKNSAALQIGESVFFAIIFTIATVGLFLLHYYGPHWGDWTLIVAAVTAFGAGMFERDMVNSIEHSLESFRTGTRLNVICELDDNSIIVKELDKNFQELPENHRINSPEGSLLCEKPETFPAMYIVRETNGKKELALVEG